MKGNTFVGSHYGIWTYNAPVLGHGNTYADSVAVPISQTPGPARVTIGKPVRTHPHTVVPSGAAQANQPVTILGKVYHHRYQTVAVAHPRAEKYRAVAYGSHSRVVLLA